VTHWGIGRHNEASKLRHIRTFSVRGRLCLAPLCGRVERSLAIRAVHDSPRPRLRCRGPASGQPHFTSRGRRQTAHLRHAAASSHPQLPLVARGVRPSTPGPDEDNARARRPPCTSRRSSPMAAVHGQPEGEKTKRWGGARPRGYASPDRLKAPKEQRVRGFRPHGKANALVKMASYGLGCWITGYRGRALQWAPFQPANSPPQQARA
jgi:hypothetical protein